MKSIAARIASGFAMMLALLAVVAVTGIFSLNQLAEGIDEISGAEKLEEIFAEMRLSSQAYYASGDTADSDHFYKAIDEFENVIPQILRNGEYRDGLTGMSGDYRTRFEIITSQEFRMAQLSAKLTEKASALVTDSVEIAEREARFYIQFDKVVDGAARAVGKAAESNDMDAVVKANKKSNAARNRLNANQKTSSFANGMALQAQQAELATLEYFVDSTKLEESSAIVADASKEIFKLALKVKKIGSKKAREKAMEVAKAAQSYRKDFKTATEMQAALAVERANINKLEQEMVNLFRAAIDDVKARTKETRRIAMQILIGGFAVSIVLGIGLAWMIARSLSLPVRRLTDVVGELAQGNLKLSIPYQDRKDELGRMAVAIKVLRQYAEDARRLEQRQQEQQKEEEERQQQMRFDLASSFEQQIGHLVTGFEEASGRMSSSASSLEMVSAQARNLVDKVRENSGETSKNVDAVAAAASELTATVDLIRREVTEAERSAKDANTKTTEAAHQVADLEHAVQGIEDALILISEVTHKTHLLAMNASVEAARAGEAGLGFSVVADEVKSLAARAAEATESIASQVRHIQLASTSVMESNQAITNVVEGIGDMAGRVSASIDSHQQATEAIQQGLAEASGRVSTVSQDVVSVSEAISQTGEAVQVVQQVGGDIARNSGSLDEESRKFVANLRDDRADQG